MIIKEKMSYLIFALQDSHQIRQYSQGDIL